MLVTHCEITSYSLQKFLFAINTRSSLQNWLVTHSTNCLLHKFTRYSLQNSLVTFCNSFSLQNLIVTCCRNGSLQKLHAARYDIYAYWKTLGEIFSFLSIISFLSPPSLPIGKHRIWLDCLPLVQLMSIVGLYPLPPLKNYVLEFLKKIY